MGGNRFLILAILLAAVLISSCGGPVGMDLEGVTWELSSMGGYSLISGTRITLSFVGGEVRGNAGCNTYFGGYDLSGTGDLQITDIGATEMACLSPQGVMQQESTYLQYLASVVKAVRIEYELRLQNAAGLDVLIFTEAPE